MTAAGNRDARPILLATDFSEDSAAAFAWAHETARAFGAPLHVLHVVHDPLDRPGTYAGRSAESLAKLEDVARGMLDRWIEDRVEALRAEGAAVAIETSLVAGIPETRILEVAERERARLIVMGGRGQTGIGSTTTSSATWGASVSSGSAKTRPTS